MTSQKLRKYQSYSTVKKIFIGIIIGLCVSYLWDHFTSIKAEKILLYDITKARSDLNKQIFSNISFSPVDIKLSWLKRGILRLGIYNGNSKTLKNVILHLTFPNDIKVIAKDGWISTGASEVFLNCVNINPQTNLILQSLELEFTKEDTHEGTYRIDGENFLTPHRKILIKAVKE